MNGLYWGIGFVVVAIVHWFVVSPGERGQVFGTLPAFVESVILGLIGVAFMLVHWFHSSTPF